MLNLDLTRIRHLVFEESVSKQPQMDPVPAAAQCELGKFERATRGGFTQDPSGLEAAP